MSESKKTRVRYGRLPEVPVEVAIPFANTREDAPSPAEAVVAAMSSSAWLEVMEPELERRETERQGRKKVKPAYSCRELESLFLYQLVCGFDSVRQMREHLTSHAGAEARELLGFTRPRQTKGQRTPLHAVPSEAMLSRYRLSWAPADAGQVKPADRAQGPTLYELKRAEVERHKAAIAARAEIYERLLERWVADYAQTPAGAAATRLLFVDGTTFHSYFTCRVTKKKIPTNEKPRSRKRCAVKPVLDKPKAEGGRAVWDGRMSESAWEALELQDPSFRRYWRYSGEGGYLAQDAGENRFGHGWSIINVVDSDGMPIDFQVDAIQAPEEARATELFDAFGTKLQAFPPCDGLRVVAADAGFRYGYLARAVRRQGMLECIPRVSGKNEPRLEEWRAQEIDLAYLPRGATRRNRKWHTDGFGTLRCRCGQGQVKKKFFNGEKGKLVPRLEGRCPKCGPISVTSGEWVGSGGRWVERTSLRLPLNDEDEKKRDAALRRAIFLGNPLTQTDPIATAYSRRRFAVHEGVHSILTTRFGLIRGKRRVKYTDEVRLRTAATFTLLHAIAHEQRQRAAAREQMSEPLARAA